MGKRESVDERDANQSMEPMGIERHRRSPKGERTGVSEWSLREAVRHRRAKRRSQTENWEIRVNQSKSKGRHVPSYPTRSYWKNVPGGNGACPARSKAEIACSKDFRFVSNVDFSTTLFDGRSYCSP